MKIKLCFLFLFMNLIVGIKAADINEFFGPVFPIEQALQQLAGPNQIGTLSPGQISQAFEIGGIKLTSVGASQIQQKVDDLEYIITFSMMFSNASTIQSFLNSGGGIQITLAEAQIIFNHINGGGSTVGNNAHVYLLSLIASRTDAIIQMFMQQISDPGNPNSAAKRTIDNILKKVTKLMKFNFKPVDSGGDWFENAYTSLSTSFTRFDDIAANGSGKETSFSLTVGGDIGADTSLSFSLSKSYSHRGGTTSLTFESLSGDITIHHKINEYFGAGMYGFYADTDIHEFESHAYAYGGGLLLTGAYDFGYFSLSTVQTFNKIWHKFGHDQLYVGSFSISRSWTDYLSTSFNAAYTDSLKRDVDDDGDNSYWTVGGDVYWTLTENATLSFGYERIVALTDYRSHTFSLNFTWYF